MESSSACGPLPGYLWNNGRVRELPELGGGNGSIAEWLCAAVSPSGSVTAVDIETALLELIPAQNLTVRQMDLRTGELPPNAYDLVTCRALLHQIADYAPALLAKMAAAVKPGGWLLVQEPLWFYVLREAQVTAGGEHLGPVGGRIVAEVIVGLIQGDRQSCLRQDPDWTPTYGSAGSFTIVDLLTAAGAVATIP